MILTKKRYIFRGSAVAIGAQTTGLNDEERQRLCFEGSAALPPSGGYMRSRCDERDIQVPGLSLSFRKASASILGTLLPDSAHVEAKASVADVRVQNHLTIEHVQAGLIADDPLNHGQIRFKAPEMPSITGVIAGNAELEVMIDDVFLAIPTKQALIDEYAHDAGFRECFKDRFFRTGKDFPGLFRHVVPEIGGYIVTSIVKSLRFKKDAAEGAVIQGNQVTLPGFGTLYFGELLIGTHQRILTMVRMELQAPRVRSADALSFDAASDGDSRSAGEVSAIDPGKPGMLP